MVQVLITCNKKHIDFLLYITLRYVSKAHPIFTHIPYLLFNCPHLSHLNMFCLFISQQWPMKPLSRWWNKLVMTDMWYPKHASIKSFWCFWGPNRWIRFFFFALTLHFNMFGRDKIWCINNSLFDLCTVWCLLSCNKDIYKVHIWMRNDRLSWGPGEKWNHDIRKITYTPPMDMGIGETK